MRGLSILHEHLRRGGAVPAFVIYNLETAQAVVAAAERCGRAVLLQAGASAFKHAGREPLARMAVQLAMAADVPIGVHLDHSRSLQEVRACLELGYTSVMIDGSHLPYRENVALTQEAVAQAHQFGAWAEAELAAIAGDEDRSTNAVAEVMTDPQVAADFVAATGVDALAVAVGNVHGYTEMPPDIDFARLDALRQSTGVPLVLHGGSGLSPHVLRRCIELGVVKVNINTELRRAYLDGVTDALPGSLESWDLAGLLGAGRAAASETAVRLIKLMADGPVQSRA